MPSHATAPAEPTSDYVGEFVTAMIRAGSLLAEVLDNLVDSMAETGADADVGAEELLAMLIETVRDAVSAAGEGPVKAVTPVLDACVRRTLEDLGAAVALLHRDVA